MQDFAPCKVPVIAGAEPKLFSREIRKICLVMKITAILLLTASLQVSAKGWSQEKINLSFKDASLEQVFNSITAQTGISFFYRPEYVKDKKVTINVTNASLKTVMEMSLKGQDLVWDVVGKTVAVRPAKKENSADATEANNLYLPIDVKGRVVNEKGEPVEGVTVTIKGGNTSTKTNSNGEFTLSSVDQGATLVFTHVSLETFELNVKGKQDLTISLKTKVSALGDVTVTVNTGYQQIPKERATGSFAFLDREQLNRRVGPDILSRLEGITTGILFDRRTNTANQNGIEPNSILIRGLATLSESTKAPLIVVNNFPYDGDINDINPNDVESVTILKDAGAASIWGARAGNGVIVITTRQGSFNQSAKVSFYSNFTSTKKPDLFKFPYMSSSDFIEVEKFLFSKNFFYDEITDNYTYPALSPVVEILDKEKKGQISTSDANSLIDQFRSQDVRESFSKYVYRTSLNQQYAVNLSGGSQTIRYSVSGGYDRIKSTLVGDEGKRLTFRSGISFIPIKKLQFQMDLNYSNNRTQNNSLGNIGSQKYDYRSLVSGYYVRKLYPYAKFADDNGNPIWLTREYQTGYLDTAGGGKLLNWKFSPLDELRNADNTIQSGDVVLNLKTNYKITDYLNVEGGYQFQRINGQSRNYYNENTYFTRNLINLYTQIAGNTVTYPLPKGGILDLNEFNRESQMGRVQLNLNKSISRSQIVAIAGAEIRESKRFDHNERFYGYNDKNLSISSVDYINTFRQYVGGGRSRITEIKGLSESVDHFVSLFSNASYTYDGKYTISGSVRKDASNLFGVDINDKWKPFWTTGVSWAISNEKFFNSKAVSYLKLRSSFGYQGNVNNKLAPYTIIQYLSANSSPINQVMANISVPANPGLSWETIRQFNIGLDFGLFQGRVNGSLEGYTKTSDNIILNSTLDPTTGLSAVNRNSAGVNSKGIEILISSKNVLMKTFRWSTELGVSLQKNEVTKVLIDHSNFTQQNYVTGNGTTIRTLVGVSPYPIFSYAFAGLDPTNGNPLGYLGKTESTNYNAIFRQLYDTSNSGVIYNGSAIPTVFGFLNNTFSYKRISITANINYRLGYYFKKSTLSYYKLYYEGVTHPDYSKRWQQPGDEAFTNIPSRPYPLSNDRRDVFYANTSVNVLKGDNIRLQFIRLSYDMDKFNFRKIPFNHLQVYGLVENLGIIWRANKEGLDPDYDSGNTPFPPPKQFSFGLRADF